MPFAAFSFAYSFARSLFEHCRRTIYHQSCIVCQFQMIKFHCENIRVLTFSLLLNSKTFPFVELYFFFFILIVDKRTSIASTYLLRFSLCLSPLVGVSHSIGRDEKKKDHLMACDAPSFWLVMLHELIDLIECAHFFSRYFQSCIGSIHSHSSVNTDMYFTERSAAIQKCRCNARKFLYILAWENTKKMK